MWKDVTLHIWIWISTFKGTGNRLPKHCNRLQLFEINWNVVNSIWKLFQNNFATGNRLPESKNSLVNMFWEKPCAIQFLRKTFSYLSWLSLLLILESWVLNLDLDSWDLEPWIFILDSKLSSWVLNSSWFLSWTLELFLIHLSCSLIDLWAFCHYLCHHLLLSSKHLWITFDSPLSFASTPFFITHLLEE